MVDPLNMRNQPLGPRKTCALQEPLPKTYTVKKKKKKHPLMCTQCAQCTLPFPLLNGKESGILQEAMPIYLARNSPWGHVGR